MTIDEFKKNIAPYMKRGYVAMGNLKQDWFYTKTKPEYCEEVGLWLAINPIDLDMFNIDMVENHKESLMKVGK